MSAKEPLAGKTLNELKELVLKLGLPSYSDGQLAHWLYKKRVGKIEQMTNLSKQNQLLLAEKFVVGLTPFQEFQQSKDGTKKYLFSADDNKFIESVYIPETDRRTLCVSSQVGCKMNCAFCMTGKQGFQGNLTTTQILNQILSIPESEKLTNIVFMGMGEPFDNLPNVLNCLEILTSDYGFGWSPKRITVSTIGLIPPMKTFIEESDCHLAVSLHNPFHVERLELMPIEKTYPIHEIVDVLKTYDFGRQRRISFEYIMFDGYNDTPRHVNELSRLLNGLNCRINLIRFHPIPGSTLKGSSDKTILDFQSGLKKKGISTTIRGSRGLDILAACGLLSTRSMNNPGM